MTSIEANLAQDNAQVANAGVIILPPVEIRKIADKSAEFVAKNGASFEELLIKAESNNPKFSFLKLDDPYRAYYEHKVAEFTQQQQLIANSSKPGQSVPKPGVQTGTTNEANIDKGITQSATGAGTINPQRLFPGQQVPGFAVNLNTAAVAPGTAPTVPKKDLKKELKPPAPDLFTVQTPVNISPLEMDVIKHTAQFVAKNGQKFLIALTEREKNNPQFDFLKPNHQSFSYLTNLIDAFSKCLMPKKDDLYKLQNNIRDRMSILNRVGLRFEYENNQKQAKKKKEELDEEERLQMAQIDWNDFIVVETIDLLDNEELPAPNNFSKKDKNDKQPNLSNISSKKSEPKLKKTFKDKPELNEFEDMKKQQKLDNKQIAPPAGPIKPFPSQIPLNGQSFNISLPQNQPPVQELPTFPVENDPKVRKGYVRKTESTESQTSKCPICGHFIPVDEIEEHLRIELLNNNNSQEKKFDTTKSLALDNRMTEYLKNFADKRPDIFGTVEDQFQIGEEKNKSSRPVASWDGHSSSLSRTTASMAMLAQQQKKNIEESMKAQSEKEKKDIIPPKPLMSNVQPPGIQLPFQMPQQNVPGGQFPKKPSIPVTFPPGPVSGGVKPPEGFQLGSHQIQAQPTTGQTQEGLLGANLLSTLAKPLTAGPQLPTLNMPLLGLPKLPVPNLLGSGLDQSKLGKTEDGPALCPEELWLQMNPGEVTINIQVPDSGEEAWNFKGQMIQLQLDPKTSFGGIKDILSGILGGMPQAKMKLKSKLISVFKDNYSLAYYNLINNTVLELSTKERGGRGRNK